MPIASLKRLEEKLKWIPCVKCGEEWNRLCDGGLCFACEGIGQKKNASNEMLSRIVGPRAFETMRFNSFKTPTMTHESLLETCLNFRPDRDNLYLYGPCGSGKTHLANAIFLEWFDALRGNAGMERPRALGRHLRGKLPFEEEAIVQRISRKKLLVIDDLGMEKGSEFMFGLLYEITDFRIQHGVAGLVITTNLTMDEIAKRFGDDRLSSRLNHICKIVEFSVNDWRTQVHDGRNIYEPD